MFQSTRGAKQTLQDVEVILAEVNLLDIYKDARLLDDLIIFLHSARKWFAAYDICSFHRRPLDAALWQADLIFLPMGSSLRADKRWSQ